ncbi:MAG: ubiquitin-conjugating enzyme E2 [Pirellulales bacterium]
MSTVRLRRLGADHAKVKEYVRRHPRVRLIQAQGEPPERYQFEYRIRSLRMVNGELQNVDTHLVEVTLPLNYPRTPPQCRMLSPVFHPNIAPHAICVGDHWSAGESLESIITRIGEMLAYQSYNVKSPLNGEAARWVEENKHRVPLDGVSMLVEDPDRDDEFPPAARAGHQDPPAPRAPQPTAAATPAATAAQINCPSCGTSYRLMDSLRGHKVRCKKCENVFEVPAA